MAAAKPYYDKPGASRSAVEDHLSTLGARRKGEHGNGIAYTLAAGGWALVTPKNGGPVRLRLYAGPCPCGGG